MINSFDTEVAQDVGIVAAILYKNIQYWCLKNKANEINEHDGLFWTYNSMKAYQELFPYLGVKAIRAGLDKLEERGYIKVGNFNENKRDRTRWYADLHLTSNIEEPKESDSNMPKGQMQEDEKDTCNMPKGQMESAKKANASSEKGKALPNNYQITTTNNNKKERKKAESTRATFDEILDSYEVIKNSPELRDAWIAFIQMRQRIRAPLTDRALELNIKKAFELAKDDPNIVLKIVNNSIAKGYRGVFPDEDRSQNSDQSDNPYTKMLKDRGLA